MGKPPSGPNRHLCRVVRHGTRVRCAPIAVSRLRPASSELTLLPRANPSGETGNQIRFAVSFVASPNFFCLLVGALLSCAAPRVLWPRHHPLDRAEKGCTAASQGWRGGGGCSFVEAALRAPEFVGDKGGTARHHPGRSPWQAPPRPGSRSRVPGSLIDGLSSQPEVDARRGYAPQSSASIDFGLSLTRWQPSLAVEAVAATSPMQVSSGAFKAPSEARPAGQPGVAPMHRSHFLR